MSWETKKNHYILITIKIPRNQYKLFYVPLTELKTEILGHKERM